MDATQERIVSYTMGYMEQRIAAEASADARASFIRQTYGHLAIALLAFAGLETLLVKSVPADTIQHLFFAGRFSWLIVMAAFMGVAYLADYWARSGGSPAMQYLGLALYVTAQAIIFLPLLHIAVYFSDPTLIPKAGIMTLMLFGGLTFAVFITRSDFSFMRTFLSIACFAALGIIVISIFMGTDLGLWFSAAMIVLAGGFILYDTSNILYHYRTDQHVAAALALFASIALLFWYVLRFLMAASNRR
jgi:FtsH-binding integral membrane protein